MRLSSIPDAVMSERTKVDGAQHRKKIQSTVPELLRILCVCVSLLKLGNENRLITQLDN